MGLLQKLLGRRKTDAPLMSGECPHSVVAPLWDRAEDIGRDDRATAYRCGTCRMTFTVVEGQRLAGKVICLD